ncbi:glycosyltransferase family 2 protein [Solirubrobacter sp. CPCC 204708]|uniref:Glycosyltransferase family 2 protein n=1 Tax=Solirubrobacter deserti TaxID=2282478 RepID=A0ABT4RRZ6_9ACTN|nr:glycosyltransferase family 2 protein [Solirubrobacter deserti]MBE2318739.1 glycosyltransferase family 2 protein [Solirubrobacter deserti]MDA0141329.1 glycosyltransferase family 2 protein [Solirubrobacter deserti]
MEPVTAVILSHNRKERLVGVLEELLRLDVFDEIIVADSSSDGSAEAVQAFGEPVRLVPVPNLGAAGRNLGAEAARNELIVMLDDDSHPCPGAVERLVAAFEANDRLGVATGLVRDVDPDSGEILVSTELGSFDWWFRRGRPGAPAEGMDCYFFAEGCCMVRRTPFLEVGGFFAPYFFTLSEIDVTVRLAGAGWETRYFPDAPFDHLRPLSRKPASARTLQLRTRNNQWHLWLRYPVAMAVPRMAFHAVFDLVDATYLGHHKAWLQGIREAWTQRGDVAEYRRPIPAAVLRPVEGPRTRQHVDLLIGQLRKKLRKRLP